MPIKKAGHNVFKALNPEPCISKPIMHILKPLTVTDVNLKITLLQAKTVKLLGKGKQR